MTISQEAARRIFKHVAEHIIESGKQYIETPFGLGHRGWMDADITILTDERYEQGDYLLPDYLEVKLRGIVLQSGTIHIDDDDYEGAEFDRETLDAINNELVKLCA